VVVGQVITEFPWGIQACAAVYFLLMFGLLALAVASLIAAAREYRRRKTGRCEECGYDLRATPKDTSCPECGATRVPLA
jgi:hypothetical protein